ncbi:unnamed protein product, partial [Discosporangium mesarthrocarpum]
MRWTCAHHCSGVALQLLHVGTEGYSLLLTDRCLCPIGIGGYGFIDVIYRVRIHVTPEGKPTHENLKVEQYNSLARTSKSRGEEAIGQRRIPKYAYTKEEPWTCRESAIHLAQSFVLTSLYGFSILISSETVHQLSNCLLRKNGSTPNAHSGHIVSIHRTENDLISRRGNEDLNS